jgi:glycosyltransferase involved in cell wall biosynthesis
MRVFLAAFDLFSTVGGGQTFYRSVIQANPGIEFAYLRRYEGAAAALPPNARAIPFREKYAHLELRAFYDPGPPAWTHSAFIAANNIAFSAAGRGFDVVEFPDYEQFGVFLGDALRAHGVPFRHTALSMHGAISTTHALNWQADRAVNQGLRKLEELQYAAADIRYFISRAYQDEWRQVCGLESHYIDPMTFFTPPGRRPYRPSPEKPALHFIGRTEKRKGPHVFLQLLWWLPRSCWGSAAVIGPESIDLTGTGSGHHLEQIAAPRGLDVAFVDSMTPDELAVLFAGKSVTVVPSEYDTLNLIALESLFAGCPTVIGTGAGVCRYLRERLPEIPFEVIDYGGNFFADVLRLERFLGDYDRQRDNLASALEAVDRTPHGVGLDAVYRSPAAFDPMARARTGEWFDRLARCVFGRRHWGRMCASRQRMPA